MLAASVEMPEWFFMEENGQSVPIEGLSHDLHGQYILIDGGTSFWVNADDLKLIDCVFIVPSFEGNSDFDQLLLYLGEHILNHMRHFCVVMLS